MSLNTDLHCTVQFTKLAHRYLCFQGVAGMGNAPITQGYEPCLCLAPPTFFVVKDSCPFAGTCTPSIWLKARYAARYTTKGLGYHMRIGLILLPSQGIVRPLHQWHHAGLTRLALATFRQTTDCSTVELQPLNKVLLRRAIWQAWWNPFVLKSNAILRSSVLAHPRGFEPRYYKLTACLITVMIKMNILQTTRHPSRN